MKQPFLMDFHGMPIAILLNSHIAYKVTNPPVFIRTYPPGH